MRRRRELIDCLLQRWRARRADLLQDGAVRVARLLKQLPGRKICGLWTTVQLEQIFNLLQIVLQPRALRERERESTVCMVLVLTGWTYLGPL